MTSFEKTFKTVPQQFVKWCTCKLSWYNVFVHSCYSNFRKFHRNFCMWSFCLHVPLAWIITWESVVFLATSCIKKKVIRSWVEESLEETGTTILTMCLPQLTASMLFYQSFFNLYFHCLSFEGMRIPFLLCSNLFWAQILVNKSCTCLTIKGAESWKYA